MKHWGLLLAVFAAAAGAHAAETIEALPLEKHVSDTITSLAQIEKIAYATQVQFWKLVPPSDSDLLYIHPDSTVSRPELENMSETIIL